MTLNGIKLLLAICGFLLIVLFLEMQLFGISDEQAENISLASTQEKKKLVLPEIQLSKQSKEKYLNMVERPLFNNARKPIEGQQGNNGQQSNFKLDDLILVGIYSAEEQLVALFSKPEASDKFIKKNLGDEIAGWMIVDIQQDRVDLEKDEQEQSLMLRKSKNTKSQTPRRQNRMSLGNN